MSRSSQGRRVVAAQVRRLFFPPVILDDASLAQVGVMLAHQSRSVVLNTLSHAYHKMLRQPFENAPVPPTSWFTSGTPTMTAGTGDAETQKSGSSCW